jgi:hypothetical protein
MRGRQTLTESDVPRLLLFYFFSRIGVRMQTLDWAIVAGYFALLLGVDWWVIAAI